jgi:hypothetical protein
VNTHNPAHLQTPESDWQILGELKIPIGVNTVDVIQSWLGKVLAPLNSSINFLTKVIQASQDSFTQALQLDSAKKIGQIHLSVFVPYEPFSEGRTWGFFYISKIGIQVEDIATHEHTIDFYLYVEGE